MCTLVLLDLDGTLTDPFTGISNCIRYALDRLEFPSPPDSDIRFWIGPPLKASFEKLLGPARADKAVALYRERFGLIGLYENQVYDGIPESLERLRSRGFRLALATSKARIYAERIVEHFGLSCFLSAVYGAELDGTRSGKSELIAYALAQEGVAPEDTLMVGDRRYDMEGARANGVKALGVLWGYGSVVELQEAGAYDLCESPESLVPLVEAWSRSRLS